MSRTTRPAGARRDWGADDSGCSILHVDMDAFFAEVELLRRPELRGRPVVVGGERRAVVLSATYEARAYGVHAAMPVAQARVACPQAVFLAPDHTRYRDASEAVMAILAAVTPVVEPVSIDEAFLDVSGARRRLGSPSRIGALVRERIRAQVGIPASVGIAGSKFVAKLASGHAKPDGLLLVPLASTVEFLHSLPVEALWGVGGRTADLLAGRGIRSVRDLADTPVDALERLLGPSAGRRLHHLAWGRDPRPVEPERRERSLGTESTFPEDLTDRDALAAVLLGQADRVATRLRAAGLLARTVSLKVRMADFTTITRSRTLEAPSDLAHDLYAAARDLLDGVALPADGVRLLGVRGEGLVRTGGAAIQASFDDLGAPDHRAAEQAVDRVRSRYGSDSVTPAALLRQPATAAAIGDLS